MPDHHGSPVSLGLCVQDFRVNGCKWSTSYMVIWMIMNGFSEQTGVSSSGHWSLVTLFTVSTFWSKKDRVTSDQVCLESHTCHTKMVRPLCGRLWPYSCPKYHFWRKSRRKAWFLSFEASFLKEVSQKSFVLEFKTQMETYVGFWRIYIYISYIVYRGFVDSREQV